MTDSITTGSRISAVCLVCIPTADQDKALDFYVGSLGFEKRTDVPMGPNMRWVEVYPPNGGTGIALAPPPQGMQPGGASTGITLGTDDVEASRSHLESVGADVDAEVSRMGDPVPPMFWVRDPEGNSLIVVEQP